MSQASGRRAQRKAKPAIRQLLELARRHGILPAYRDEAGALRRVPPESLRRLLELMGIAARTPAELRGSLEAARDAGWVRLTDDVLVVRLSRLPRQWAISVPSQPADLSSLRIRWTLTDEAGARRTGRLRGRPRVLARRRIHGTPYAKVALPFFSRLSIGYYEVDVVVEQGGQTRSSRMRLIVAPDRCLLPGDGTKQGWGLTAQLYGIRSSRNWGVGDFTDLRHLVEWAGRRLGAAMVGINPLHALPPGVISPYSASSRLFHTPLYLDLEAIDEFRSDRAMRELAQQPAFQARLKALREAKLVQYQAVTRLKQTFFERLFRRFVRHHLARKTARASAFRRFVQEEGKPLERFALFQALAEHFRHRGRSGGWRRWPPEYRQPATEAVRRFQARHRSRLEFFQYLEWLCQEQLASAQAAAGRAGMSIGIYQDMAVGIDPDGADAWCFQDQLAADASIGTPPELFSPAGQNWHLAPLIPEHVRADGYRLFAETYRRNLRSCGLLRIDHAMSLFRLFWIPDGLRARDGGYVRYPFEEFLAVLAVESHRQQVAIVGEDLGTVTPAIRRRLSTGGLLSYRLLLFEQTAQGRFARPSRFPVQALAAVTTHDLPTLKGFWLGRDIDWKRRLRLYATRAMEARDRRTRRRERQALLDAVRREGLLPRDCPTSATEIRAPSDALCRAVYAYLARTPSRLVAISLEDLLGDTETPNLPGRHAYPSWRLKAGPPGTTLEDWPSLRQVADMARILCQERQARGRQALDRVSRAS